MVLFRVGRVQVSISARVLSLRHLLLIVNIWHGEREFARWADSTEENTHETLSILLTRHHVENDSIRYFFKVSEDKWTWSRDSANNLTFDPEFTEKFDDFIVKIRDLPVQSVTITTLSRGNSSEDDSIIETN